MTHAATPASWLGTDPGAARLATVRLLDTVRAAGAAQAEVFVVRSDARRLEHASDDVHVETDHRVQVRAWDSGGRIGVATLSGSHVVEADLESLARTAVAQCAGGPTGACVPPRLDVIDRGLDVHDRRHPELTDAMRQDVLAANRAGCANVDSRVRPGPFRYEELFEVRAYASSVGVEAEERGTRYALIGSAQDASGALRVKSQLVSRNFAEVASRPVGNDLGTRLVAALEPTEIPSGLRALVLDQRAVAALLPRIIAAFSAERIAAKQSFLEGRVGSRIASSVLHVVDDAARPGGMATRGFDERGVSPVSVNLIKEGRVGGLYQGPEAAARVDARPSGHARADGSLWPGNLVVRPGSRSRNMLFPDLGTFVLVDEVVDSAGVDPSTGEIDVGVLAFVADASRVHGCAGVRRLRCNVFDLLGAIAHICNDQQRYGIVDTATWILDGITVE